MTEFIGRDMSPTPFGRLALTDAALNTEASRAATEARALATFGAQMNKVITLIILASLFGVTPAEASLSKASPAAICVLLDNHGLATGGWKAVYGNVFGCTSNYKEIGSGFPSANNLAYQVDGDGNSVTQAMLVLNVNNKSQAASGHSALLTSAEELSIKLAAAKLPHPIKDAIRRGKTMKTKVGQTTIEVERDDWPNGKGYTLHVAFK